MGKVLDIISLFNIPRVTHDAVMLRVFPITLTGVAKRKVMKHYTKLRKDTITCFISAQLMASIAIRRSVCSSSNSKGIAAIIRKLDSLGRDIKKMKENVHAIQVGCQLYEGAHLDKESPINEEVKSEEDDIPSGVLPCQLPPKELNPGSFILPCTIGSLNFYAMADL
uniref:Uncharacterized protein n=1 Tax=Tanacetum cinerariifolium TaxID=118510 RepID=A0A699H091_TANCI|nr:hypothetical protein [Tanacetum cinerariifolium]